MIVGLCGYAGAGKDTAAAGLVAQGWTRVALADPLKLAAYELGWDGTKSPAGRRLLQRFGRALRVLDPDMLILLAKRRIEEIKGDVVIPDVRFPNEVRFVHAHEGLVVRIDRPGLQPQKDVTEQPNILNCDAVVINDSTPQVLHQRLMAALHAVRCTRCGALVSVMTGICLTCGMLAPQE
jgi:hypothetical protein